MDAYTFLQAFFREVASGLAMAGRPRSPYVIRVIRVIRVISNPNKVFIQSDIFRSEF